MSDLPALLTELERLEAAATRPSGHKVARYDHGGGRVYIEGVPPKYETRELIADFFGESERECWIAARAALPRLLALARAGAKLRALFMPNSAGEACEEWDRAAREAEKGRG